MNTIYVLYDLYCPWSSQWARWLCRRAAFVELRFIPLQSSEVPCRFPGLEALSSGESLLVVSDEGAVYRGAPAWIMCLYALRSFREWAIYLARPALLPYARVACPFILRGRLRLGRWLGREEQLVQWLEAHSPPPGGPSTLSKLLEEKLTLSR
jgi:predicted DCC family thiol-disulfide oxidoreductase YuxK